MKFFEYKYERKYTYLRCRRGEKVKDCYESSSVIRSNINHKGAGLLRKHLLL